MIKQCVYVNPAAVRMLKHGHFTSLYCSRDLQRMPPSSIMHSQIMHNTSEKSQQIWTASQLLSITNKQYNELRVDKCLTVMNIHDCRCRLGTYVVWDDEPLVHDVIDILYDITNCFQCFFHGHSLLHRHTQAWQFLHSTHLSLIHISEPTRPY